MKDKISQHHSFDITAGFKKQLRGIWNERLPDKVITIYKLSKYKYIIVHLMVHLKVSWAGLVCHTHQHYHHQ